MSVGLIAAVVWVLLPVTRVNRLLEETASDYDGMRAELRLNEAALADPLSSKPWEHLAALRLGQLLVEPTERNWDSFRQATDEVVRRNRHWAPLHRQIGDWHQAVAERSPVLRSRAQERMIRAYLRTIELHNGNAFYHAQLAWAYHVVGKAQAASQEADLALKLDSGMPHEELQLANQNLIEGMRVSKISAERRMQQLRNQ